MGRRKDEGEGIFLSQEKIEPRLKEDKKGRIVALSVSAILPVQLFLSALFCSFCFSSICKILVGSFVLIIFTVPLSGPALLIGFCVILTVAFVFNHNFSARRFLASASRVLFINFFRFNFI